MKKSKYFRKTLGISISAMVISLLTVTAYSLYIKSGIVSEVMVNTSSLGVKNQISTSVISKFSLSKDTFIVKAPLSSIFNNSTVR